MPESSPGLNQSNTAGKAGCVCLYRIKMCRRAAHKASGTAATVAGGVADTGMRVADSMVKRMGGSNYGQ